MKEVRMQNCAQIVLGNFLLKTLDMLVVLPFLF